MPWHWGHDQQSVFETLQDAMCEKPVLQQPDFTKPFYVLTDASAYGVGAILSQEGESAILQIAHAKKPKLHPVAYYLATFTETERNYDIYDRELLAIMKAITHWRPYLIWTEQPFTIYTDHANLLYWKSPRKLNHRTAWWHSELQDYHFTLEHVPGKTYTAADALSQPPGSNEGKQDNQQIVILPEKTFTCLADADSDGSLESMIVNCQNQYAPTMKEWESTHPITPTQTMSQTFWKDDNELCLVIPSNDSLKRQIMRIWHDAPMAGHPGRDETIRLLCTDSWYVSALLCGNWTAYCMDMGLCESRLPFLEPFVILLSRCVPLTEGYLYDRLSSALILGR